MRILICGDAAEAAVAAATEIADYVRSNPAGVVGLATGGTMEPLYAALVAEHRAGRLSFAGVTTFNLDEYIGVPPDHPASYHYFMRQHLFDRVDIRPERTHLPRGCGNLEAECQRYEEAIAAAGGIDLQLLGIGTDGHIGFNEPGSSLASRTRVKTLARQTRRDNARFFDSPEAVPKTAVTMGVATILDARAILLLATGRGKADAVAAAVEGPVTAAVTASALQLHPRVTLVLDDAAAARLRHADDYRAAEEQRQLIQASPRP